MYTNSGGTIAVDNGYIKWGSGRSTQVGEIESGQIASLSICG